ncbi:MAG: hypothetical protein L3K15_07000 [Thermoplasmata archaeon]|nr:hypothetical protein [Thermoplasmata archaeon]
MASADGIHNCYSSATYTGSFTTSTASTSTQPTFYGTVYDSNLATAPSGMVIEIDCWMTNGLGMKSAYTTTSSTGYWSASNTGFQWDLGYCSWYQVAVYNGVDPSGGSYPNPTLWAGHWNLTDKVYWGGEVDLVLPSNSQVWVPQFLMFTNSPYVAFSATQTTDVSTTTSWNVAGNGMTASNTVSGSQTISSGNGHNFEVREQFWASGTWFFDATAGRVGSLLSLTYIQPTSNSPNPDTVTQFATDSASPTSAPACNGVNPYCSNVAGCSTPCTVPPTYQKSVTFSGSLALSVGLDVTLSASIGPSWASVGVSADLSFTVTSTTSSSVGVTYAFANTDTAAHNFEIWIEGSSTAGNGIVIHFWQTS